MKRTNNEDKSYILMADKGKDLILKDSVGNIVIRTKEVHVPPAGTINTWGEVDELPPEPEVVIDPKQQELAELEARIAQLKTEVSTV